MKTIAIILALSGLFYGCEKDPLPTSPGNPTDVTYPVVKIDSPPDGAIFHNGDIVRISGKATDNRLKSGVAEIVDNSTGRIYFHVDIEVLNGEQEKDFSYTWMAAVEHSADVTLTVTFRDYQGNATATAKTIKIDP